MIAHTDVIATDGCKTSAAAVPQGSMRCAACSQPVEKHMAACCWVCIDKAQNFDTQLDEATSAHEDTLRADFLDKHPAYIGGMLLAYPQLSARQVIDMARSLKAKGEL